MCSLFLKETPVLFCKYVRNRCSDFHVVVNYYFMSLSFKFHNDPNLGCEDIGKIKMTFCNQLKIWIPDILFTTLFPCHNNINNNKNNNNNLTSTRNGPACLKFGLG